MSLGRMKYILMSLLAMVFLGCGESESSEIAGKHDRICESTTSASNCPDNVDLSGLVMFCKLTSDVYLDTEDCNDKMDAYVTCNSQRSWVCLEGGEIPVPAQPDSCASAILEPFTLPDGECVDQSKVNSN